MSRKLSMAAVIASSFCTAQTVSIHNVNRGYYGAAQEPWQRIGKRKMRKLK